MIGDILDLSKIESGTLKFVWSDVNINAMIYDLEKVFQLRNKNNPEVEIRFVPGMERVRDSYRATYGGADRC